MADKEDAIAEWNSVRDENLGENPPVGEDKPQEEPEVKTEVEVDPYEGLPAIVKEKLANFEEIAKQNQQLALQVREFSGRVSGLQSEFAKSRQAQQLAAPTQAQAAAAAKDPEQWESLKADFPEWGTGIEAFLNARLEKLGGQIVTPDQIQAMVAQQTSNYRTEVQESFVAMKHGGWKDTLRSPEFNQWFAAQSPELQALAQSDEARDAILVLDRFEESKAKPVSQVKEQRQQKLAAAVTTAPGKAAPVKTFDNMTPKEQWDFMAEERARKAA